MDILNDGVINNTLRIVSLYCLYLTVKGVNVPKLIEFVKTARCTPERSPSPKFTMNRRQFRTQRSREQCLICTL